MTVPRGNVRITCNVGRIRSNVPLRPTFVDDETWYCGTAIAVPYVKLHKDFAVTAYYNDIKRKGCDPVGIASFLSLFRYQVGS